jgi:hypothetical protein
MRFHESTQSCAVSGEPSLHFASGSHQRVEHRLDQLRFAQAGDRVRIEIGRLGADADMEDAFAVAFLDQCLALRAAGDSQKTEDGGQKAEGC